MFVRGYLGTNSSVIGHVVSVTGRGVPDQLGNTLAPSDMCPTFKDDSSKQQSEWRSRWLPAFIERLSQYIDGDLTLDDATWNDFPYVCGFESQITGYMSPFCDTFTQEELEQYEYQQDLRYYYGVGPGANVSSKMMVPFLRALMDRFVEGPGAEGTLPDGSSFTLPKLIMSFLNDGQLNQLAVATGAFDEQEPLSLDRIPEDRLWRSSRISPMRGTIAFERLNCRVPKPCKSKRDESNSTVSRNETFVRLRINEAVYPIPSCQEGPGKSCRVEDYVEYLSDKLEANGDFATICNATDPATPTKIQGASFFTDLAQSHLQIIEP